MNWFDILKEPCEECSMEKVAGAVTTSAPAHAHLFRPTYSGKKRRKCKSCRK
jgi:hypothetical protein